MVAKALVKVVVAQEDGGTGDWEALVRAVALGMAWVAWVKDWGEKAWARGAGVLVGGERAEA